MNERSLDPATHYRLLKLLEKDPQVSQRELAERMGVSVGKINYCLRAVVERGHAKTVNFRNSQNRVAYLYKLTPAGIAAKLRVARRFLALKESQYAALKKEIRQLQLEVDGDRES